MRCISYEKDYFPLSFLGSTPKPQPKVYDSEFLNHVGVKGDAWGMVQAGWGKSICDVLHPHTHTHTNRLTNTNNHARYKCSNMGNTQLHDLFFGPGSTGSSCPQARTWKEYCRTVGAQMKGPVGCQHIISFTL